MINLILSVSSQFIRICAVMVFTAILARKLPISDFGILSIVGVVGNFATLLTTAGFSVKTLRSENVSDNDCQQAFLLNVIVGIVSATGLFILGYLSYDIWGDLRIKNIFYIGSVVFFMSAASLQSKSYIEHELKFKLLTVIELASVLVSIGVGVLLYLEEYYLESIVILTYTRITVCSIGYFFVSSWKPRFCGFQSSAVQDFRDGVSVGVHNWLNYGARNIDKLLISRVFGLTQLGFYENAYRFLLFPITNLRAPIARVLLPTLAKSKLAQDRSKIYLKYHVVVCSTIIPLMVCLGIHADYIVSLVLGNGWDKTAQIFKWFSVIGVIQPVVTLTGVVILASGDMKKYRNWGASYAVFSVLSYIVGTASDDVIGVAVTYTIFNILSANYFVKTALCSSGISRKPFWSIYITCLLIALAISGGLYKFPLNDNPLIYAPLGGLISLILCFSIHRKRLMTP
ncbi:oligosaccharide flippase family protein [Verrucomicrobiaceae bacterium R5-34]|nr:oligosaccharide flippase family protein [Verrucomicrobiaceae bacterium R5-34]